MWTYTSFYQRDGCINLSPRFNLKPCFQCVEMSCLCACLQMFAFNLNESLIMYSILANILYQTGQSPSTIYCVRHLCCINIFIKCALPSSLLLTHNLFDFSLCQLVTSFLLWVSSGSFLLFPQKFLSGMQ